MTDKEIKTIRRLQAAFQNAQRELEQLLENQAPKVPVERKRANLKDARVAEFEKNRAAGTWRKPLELRKTSR